MKFTSIFSADDFNQGEGLTNKQARENITIEEAERFEWILTS